MKKIYIVIEFTILDLLYATKYLFNQKKMKL